MPDKTIHRAGRSQVTHRDVPVPWSSTKRRGKMKPVNFYFLSTGRCGTRFLYHTLKTCSNGEAQHQPGHEDICEMTEDLVASYMRDRESVFKARMEDFPRLRRRIDKRLARPIIYGDTLNHMWPLGYMLYRYIGPQRLRLVHLIRHPVAACRSWLAAERESFSCNDSSGVATGDFPAERVANFWLNRNSCIRDQLEMIDSPEIVRVLRLEDIDLASLRELFDFLRLEGFGNSGARLYQFDGHCEKEFPPRSSDRV